MSHRRRDVPGGLGLSLGLRAGGPLLDGGEEVQTFLIPASDEFTALTTGAEKYTFRMPYGFLLEEVRASVGVSPLGDEIIVDVNEQAVSILSPKITIDAGEESSVTAAVQPGLVDNYLADDSEITVDIDQIGSSTAGAGLKVYLVGRPLANDPNPALEVPLTIPDLAFWFDADNVASVSETGGLADAWGDRSGNSRTVNASGTDRPTYTTDSGLRAMQFTEVSGNRMSVTGLSAFNTAAASTIAVVIRQLDYSMGYTVVRPNLSTGPDLTLGNYSTTGAGRLSRHDGAPESQVFRLVTDTDRLAVISRNGSPQSDMLDSKANVDTSGPGTSLITGADEIYVGDTFSSAEPFNGFIHEIVYYERRINDTERTALMDYLKLKWSV